MEKSSWENKVFGDQLRRIRKAANLTQEELAFRAGLDRTYISLLERGIKSPTLKTFFRLCSVLNQKPEELIAIVYQILVQKPEDIPDEQYEHEEE